MGANQKIISFNVSTGEVRKESITLEVVDESTLVKNVESNVVGIYPKYTYQVVEGFGCAMTETACYLLSRLGQEERKAALECWFSEKGMNARFMRIPIDSCDYSLSEYQAVEHPLEDPELLTFNIDRDRKYIIPMVKEAMEISKHEISVLLSPWSPPADWKTPPEISQNDGAVYGNFANDVDFSKPGRCFGGRLKKEYYGSWAKYLVKFIKSYLEEGINVTMLSIQNEASAATNWDSCIWSGEEESEFLKNYLYPEMKTAGLIEKVGIFIWDHNKERMIEHIDAMMENDILDLIEGFAYHWYSGDHFDALKMMKEHYPEKVLMHSESCGLHIPGKSSAFEIAPEDIDKIPEEFRELLKVTPLEMDFRDAISYAHDIIGDINAGMQRWIDWNLMVDRTGGPRHVVGGFAAPIVFEENLTFSKTISFEYLNLIANVIEPGSVRLGVTTADDLVEVAAVRRTDGKIGFILLNKHKKDNKVNVRMNGNLIEVMLPAETLSGIIVDN